MLNKVNLYLVFLSSITALVLGCGKSANVTNVGLTGGEDCEPEVFCITRVENKDKGLDFSIKTYPNTSVNLELTLNLVNIQTSADNPYIASFDGDKKEKLFTLSVFNQADPFSYSYKYKWSYGKLSVTHDDTVVYELPWESGEAHKVTQGYNGSFSHSGEIANALDFEMSEGTKVTAARDGVVIYVVESYSDGGTDESFKGKENKVMILHSDGTLGEYLHLQKDGALVSRGDSVKAGDAIGESGNTGYSSSPHLHFHVAKPLSVSEHTTIATKFKTSDSTSTSLSEGGTYTRP